jgi:hypothetical protein
MEWRQERNEQARDHIAELRTQEAEEYSYLKIKLETEIHNLEQHLQDVKGQPTYIYLIQLDEIHLPTEQRKIRI